MEADHYENGGSVILVRFSETRDGRFIVASASGGVLAEDGKFWSQAPLKYFNSIDAAKNYVQMMPQKYRHFVFTDSV